MIDHDNNGENISACHSKTGAWTADFSTPFRSYNFGAHGKLFVKDGKLHFEGELDESAKMLFEIVCKMFNSSCIVACR